MAVADVYILPSKAAQAFLRDRVGKLSPVSAKVSPTRPFRVYDTFDSEVAASGRMLLRSAGQWKLVAPFEGVLTQPCSPNEHFTVDFNEGPVKAALGDVSRLRALTPVGAGELHDTRVALVDSAEKTRVRLHVTFLQADEGGAAALVILQGLRGYDKALEQVRSRLKQSGGKKFSGSALYAALFPTRPVYTAKPDVCVGRKEAAFDAANDIIRTYLPVARVNEPGIIDDTDIEFLHDYRIAIRKIRSVLSLFSGVYSDKTTAELKSRFSAIMAPTGSLRDLDVFLAEKAGLYALLPASLYGGLDQLVSQVAQHRADAQQALKTRLLSKAYRKEMDALTALFAKPKRLKRGPSAERSAFDYSCRLIWGRYRKVCKVAATIDEKTEDEEVHRLRIHCKKLRYLMEFFAPVFPKSEIRLILQPLKRLQDNLGLFNDYSVQQDNLRAMLEDLDETQDGAQIAIAQSIGALIVVLNRKQLEERAKVVGSFATFNDKQTRARFRALFKDKRSVA